jgi:diketogulonate reductase-like aldo/keto reductase/predicted kinase
MRAEIGLGCMRLPDDMAVEVIHAALNAGATLLDTAHAYGNEARVAEAVRTWAGPRPRVVTKGGMQPGWRPDGRASTLEQQFAESLTKLERIDLYLLHAPDPKVPLSTSVRALAKLGVPIGLSNVSLPQLQQARELAEIAAVEVALGAFHDGPFRDGLVAYCLREGIEVLAHTPLGGTKRARSLSRRPELNRKDDVSPGRLVLSWLCDLGVVPLPGARRVETASQLAPVALDDADRLALDAAFPAAARALRPRARPTLRDDGEVVLIAGIQGAGKSTHARALVERGYLRLNRDTLGGTLKGVAQRLDEALDGGAPRVVLDNTYVTRASRDRVIEIAHAHRLPVRCLWLDTPIADAQINVIERMLEKTGTLEDPDGLLPTSQLRTLRELEPPSDEEGFSAIEHVPFLRGARGGQPGQIVAVEQIGAVHLEAGVPTLFVGWRTQVSDARADIAICPHDAGPPKCWCRPPLPGLVLAWARRRAVDLSRSTFHASSTAMKQMARALGCTIIDPT